MDLPTPIWAHIARFMSPKDWAKACGTSRSAVAARTVIVCIKPRTSTSIRVGQPLEWDLDKWASCHSLFLNTENVSSSEAKDTTSQYAESVIVEHAARMPHLSSLHIISRNIVSSGTLEGRILRALLHNKVALLSVHAPITYCPKSRYLQHLVVTMTAIRAGNPQGITPAGEAPEPYTLGAILPSLRTLHIKSLIVRRSFFPHDLTGCVYLSHVSLKRVEYTSLQLPTGCKLHVEKDVEISGRHLCSISASDAPVIHALTMRNVAQKLTLSNITWPLGLPSLMVRLVELRIALDDGCFCAVGLALRYSWLQVGISGTEAPNLSLLEVNVASSLHIRVDRLPMLRTLVVVAKGKLAGEFDFDSMMRSRQVYLESAARLRVGERKLLIIKGFEIEEAWLRAGWNARLPKGFLPGNVDRCRCAACLSCLSRAGMPVVCERGATPAGFERLLAQLCQPRQPVARRPVVTERDYAELRSMLWMIGVLSAVVLVIFSSAPRKHQR